MSWQKRQKLVVKETLRKNIGWTWFFCLEVLECTNTMKCCMLRAYLRIFGANIFSIFLNLLFIRCRWLRAQTWLTTCCDFSVMKGLSLEFSCDLLKILVAQTWWSIWFGQELFPCPCWRFILFAGYRGFVLTQIESVLQSRRMRSRIDSGPHLNHTQYDFFLASTWLGLALGAEYLLQASASAQRPESMPKMLEHDHVIKFRYKAYTDEIYLGWTFGIFRPEKPELGPRCTRMAPVDAATYAFRRGSSSTHKPIPAMVRSWLRRRRLPASSTDVRLGSGVVGGGRWRRVQRGHLYSLVFSSGFCVCASSTGL